jgi:quinol monooxygenase YgiN
MTQIRASAVLKVRPGQMDAFRNFSASVIAIVKTRETGKTLVWDAYLADSESSSCFVYEEYVDADAFAQHYTNLAGAISYTKSIFEVESLSICGELPEPMVAALKTTAGPSFHYFGRTLTSLQNGTASI